MKLDNPMQFVRDFLGQKVPEAQRRAMPTYYRKALNITNILTGLLYFLILLLQIGGHRDVMVFPVILICGAVVKTLCVDRMSVNQNLIVHSVLTVLWCGWYIYTFGWNSGGQHLLLPLLMLIFFSVFVKPMYKIVGFVLLVVIRMVLFYYTQTHEPIIALATGMSVVYQTLNSLFLFVIVALNCIVFSTNIQETERQLLLDNQELHREAETDPLTELPNRRSLIDEMTLYMRENPDGQFCVAIADIDFFKRVNDTYGHACGDETLKRLAKCFRDEAQGHYRCGRWGGEEFCLFFPGMNLDQAGDVMRTVAIKVGYLRIEYGENTIQITITAGVEEYDFKSDLDVIIEQADRKLYLGKSSGRNCVIV